LSRTAVNAGTFNTGEGEAGKLVEILKSPCYTVFAPTDEGCQAARGNFRFSAPRHSQARVVTYHVAFGDVRAEDLQIEEAETVEGVN